MIVDAYTHILPAKYQAGLEAKITNRRSYMISLFFKKVGRGDIHNSSFVNRHSSFQ